ncbi:unnamed protein product [Cylicocyclus nassatus]|uniref:DNA2/NAM7 helicase-like C-terminal domain-containing protein n=1 Tax=Cylicocyclus nassatus TaxID=53992 RepID=A0AA36M5V0_CYLNA|nr:unnamed protein product [Cylicocyclus nassatus]
MNFLASDSMGPPKSRSRAHYVADDALVIGREAKMLRDATASAITDPWKDVKESGFLVDYRRMNVAISRCRHGQIILGHVRMLQKITGTGLSVGRSRQEPSSADLT